MKNLKMTLPLAILAIAATTLSCREQAKPQEAKVYKTLTVAMSDTELSTLYSASIRGEQFVDIRPQVTGVIVQTPIDEGDKVSKGQTLFVIDQVPYKAAVAVAEANVNSAEAAVAIAELNAKSGEALYEDKVISQIELQTLQNTLLSAKAALAVANAQAIAARNDLSYTEVKSPVDGVAGMLNYHVGSLVSSSSTNPLVSVSKNDMMYVYFSLPESTLLTMAQRSGSNDKLLDDMGDVKLILSNGTTYDHDGYVDAISGSVGTSTGSVTLRAQFTNPEQLLRDGSNGAVSITSSYEDVVVIPKVATFEIQNKTFVFKVVDQKANSAEVTVMPTDNGKEYIVTSGLSVGDVIIAEGAGLMREGTIVK